MCWTTLHFIAVGCSVWLNLAVQCRSEECSLVQHSSGVSAPSMCNICKLWTTEIRASKKFVKKTKITTGYGLRKKIFCWFLFIQNFTSGFICTVHSWQQFDIFLKWRKDLYATKWPWQKDFIASCAQQCIINKRSILMENNQLLTAVT